MDRLTLERFLWERRRQFGITSPHNGDIKGVAGSCRVEMTCNRAILSCLDAPDDDP
jgi:hypothetical protein